jgi:Fe-S cluster assembly ATP-binding protein
VLKDGQIIKSGNFELAKELEKVGYEDFNWCKLK